MEAKQISKTIEKVTATIPQTTNKEEPARYQCSSCKEYNLTEAEAKKAEKIGAFNFGVSGWDNCGEGVCSVCAKQQVLLRSLNLARKRIPTRYNKIEYDDVKGQDKAVCDCVKYSQENTSRWLTLTGKSGNGKTMIAAATMIFISKMYPCRSAWVNMAEFTMDLRDLIGTSNTERNYIAQYMKPDLLVMDDLGAGHGDTSYAIGAIYVLLNRRWEDCKRTIITTNMQLEDIAERLGAPIADRIIRSGTLVELEGGSVANKNRKAQDENSSN